MQFYVILTHNGEVEWVRARVGRGGREGGRSEGGGGCCKGVCPPPLLPCTYALGDSEVERVLAGAAAGHPVPAAVAVCVHAVCLPGSYTGSCKCAPLKLFFLLPLAALSHCQVAPLPFLTQRSRFFPRPPPPVIVVFRILLCAPISLSPARLKEKNSSTSNFVFYRKRVFFFES